MGYIKDDVRGTASHSICVTEEENMLRCLVLASLIACSLGKYVIEKRRKINPLKKKLICVI